MNWYDIVLGVGPDRFIPSASLRRVTYYSGLLRYLLLCVTIIFRMCFGALFVLHKPEFPVQNVSQNFVPSPVFPLRQYRFFGVISAETAGTVSLRCLFLALKQRSRTKCSVNNFSVSVFPVFSVPLISVSIFE